MLGYREEVFTSSFCGLLSVRKEPTTVFISRADAERWRAECAEMIRLGLENLSSADDWLVAKQDARRRSSVPACLRSSRSL